LLFGKNVTVKVVPPAASESSMMYAKVRPSK
jgi:hypothetical protein